MGLPTDIKGHNAREARLSEECNEIVMFFGWLVEKATVEAGKYLIKIHNRLRYFAKRM